MSTSSIVKVIIEGDAAGATKAFKDADDSASGFGDGVKKAAIAIGAAFVATGAAAVAFAKTSVDKFKDVAGEVKGLQLVTGGSAEEMSHLRYQAEAVGVSTDALGVGIKKLSINVTNNAAEFKKLGITINDAHGKTLPMDQLLANVADKFAKMPNGAEKTALAVQLFGKSGTDLIPILNKGAAGLNALSAEADKYGLTLTQGNIDAVTKATKAHREFSAAVDGLKVQFGAVLLPVINDVVSFFSSKFLPLIADVTKFVQDKFRPALADAADWVKNKYVDLKDKLKPVFADVKSGFEKAKEVIEQVVLPAFGKLYDFVTGPLLTGMEDFASFMANNFSFSVGSLSVAAFAGLSVQMAELYQAVKDLGIVKFLTQDMKALATQMGVVDAEFVLAEAPVWAVVAAIAAIAAAFYEAYQHIGPFRDAVDSVGRFLKSTFTSAVNGAKRALDDFVIGFKDPDKTITPGFSALGRFFVLFGQGVRRTFDDIAKSWRDLVSGWNDPGVELSPKVDGFQRVFIELGQKLHKAFDTISKDWESFLAGFEDPKAKAGGPRDLDKAFVDLGKNIDATKDKIVGFVDSFVDGFKDPDKKNKPVNDSSTAFFKFGQLVQQGSVLLAEFVGWIVGQVIPTLGLLIAKFELFVDGKEFQAFLIGLETAITLFNGWVQGSMAIYGALGTLIGWILNVDSAIAGLLEKLGVTKAQILQAFADPAGLLRDVGIKIMLGLVQGIASMIDTAVNVVKTVMGEIVSIAKSVVDQRSPSHVFHNIGENIMLGLAGGISANAALPKTALSDALTPMLDLMDSATAGGSSIPMGGSTASLQALLAGGASSSASPISITVNHGDMIFSGTTEQMGALVEAKLADHNKELVSLMEQHA